MGKPIEDRTLVVVDKDTLAMKIKELCAGFCAKTISLESCHEAINECEVGEMDYVVMKREVDERGKVKSGEHASG